jgi:hypothetical protein
MLPGIHHTNCAVEAEARNRWHRWICTISLAGLFIAFTGPFWLPLLLGFRSFQQLDPRLRENWWWVGFLAGSSLFYATQTARWFLRRFVKHRAEPLPADRPVAGSG